MPILTGSSAQKDGALALREAATRIRQPDIAFILVFCSVHYDLEALAREIAAAFPAVPAIGCTTSGELGESGHGTGGLVAASFPKSEFTFASAAIAEAQARDAPAMRAVLGGLKARMGGLPRKFALLLIDGLSGMEEIVSQACQSAFGDIPAVGGSAGDDERYTRTFVLHEGAFRAGQAAIAAISTTRAIMPFQTHPFSCSGAPLVITDADPQRRLIIGINGNPARNEYARALGIEPGELGPARFANAPLIARINGVDFARAIRSANPDGSLSLYCAIDRGLVLRIGRRTGLLRNRRLLFDSLRGELGEVESVLGIECTLNKGEYLDSRERDDIDRLYREERVFGFTSYGEQYRGLHMNQTLTGIAFGPAAAGAFGGAEVRGGLDGEIARLGKIIDALISHDEAMNGPGGSPFGVFHKTAFLETEVKSRTAILSGEIGELEAANRELANAKGKFQAIFDLLPTPALVSRIEDGTLLDANASFCEVLGFGKEAILGKTCGPGGLGLWPGEGERARFLERLDESGGALQGFEAELKDSSGDARPFMLSARILPLEGERLIVFEFQDVGDFARRISVLRDLSERDCLTGLPNRLLILDRLQQATRLMQRNGERMAVAFLDLDGFKEVNDRFGHKAGDAVLVETAERLKGCVRDSDTVGRMGGDEFVVLLLEPESEESCAEALSRIVDSIRAPFTLPGSSSCRVSVSVGYTVFPSDGSPPEVLLEHADLALYEAKRGGKDRVARYGAASGEA